MASPVSVRARVRVRIQVGYINFAIFRPVSGYMSEMIQGGAIIITEW